MQTKITPENVTDYPVGTTVEFHVGAYYPTYEGTVIGSEVLEATKWMDRSARLIVEYQDLETDEITTTVVCEFTNLGIGVYLLEVAEAPKTKSPWAA
jgi:hypothetical protein